MEKAILLLHLFLVIFLIALILLQRSEGGALGMGGGGGGVVTGRGAATALQKTTWYLAAGFLATSLTLTVIAQSGRKGSSVIDSLPAAVQQESQGDDGAILDALTPPTLGDDAETPPAAAGDGAGGTGDAAGESPAPAQTDEDGLVLPQN